jgi:hypothetical protein
MSVLKLTVDETDTGNERGKVCAHRSECGAGEGECLSAHVLPVLKFIVSTRFCDLKRHFPRTICCTAQRGFYRAMWYGAPL